jgi:serine/threonine protein kinase
VTIHVAGDLVAERYQIITYLAEGGMQEVYSARDLVLQKNVALKVPKNASAERRFAHSAILSARVNHPNAAKSLDYVEHNGRPYLVEELIAGEDLLRAFKKLGLMDPYLVAHVVHHIARGVAASHHAGVVHRDLKPSNIMVAPDLTFSFVKITDFGISKMAQEEIALAQEGGDDSITGSSTMVGALPYMSPEMVRTPRHAAAPADIWSIGSLGYEFLSGTKPFGQGLAAVEAIVSGTLPPLPPFVSGSTQFQELGSALYKLILACWTKDPATRPTADVVVQRCGELCYATTETRIQGTVSKLIRNGSQGFAFVPISGSDVFFHMDSVYGPKPAVGDRVYFTAYPGSPSPRAHPMVKMKQSPTTLPF